MIIDDDSEAMEDMREELMNHLTTSLEDLEIKVKK